MPDHVLQTERLTLRRPVERDRAVFVDLFASEDFMVFAGGVLDRAAGNARFDTMLQNATDVPFAKRPIVLRSTGEILGYTGVAWFEFEGRRRLEFGWRLGSGARGHGYATEAAAALLALAAESFEGELLAMIDPTNGQSKRVAAKVGFEFWKLATVDGHLDEIHRIQVARPTGPTASGAGEQ